MPGCFHTLTLIENVANIHSNIDDKLKAIFDYLQI